MKEEIYHNPVTEFAYLIPGNLLNDCWKAFRNTWTEFKNEENIKSEFFRALKEESRYSLRFTMNDAIYEGILVATARFKILPEVTSKANPEFGFSLTMDFIQIGGSIYPCASNPHEDYYLKLPELPHTYSADFWDARLSYVTPANKVAEKIRKEKFYRYLLPSFIRKNRGVASVRYPYKAEEQISAANIVGLSNAKFQLRRACYAQLYEYITSVLVDTDKSMTSRDNDYRTWQWMHYIEYSLFLTSNSFKVFLANELKEDFDISSETVPLTLANGRTISSTQYTFRSKD